MTLRELANVAYAFLTEGKTEEGVTSIDDALEGKSVPEGPPPSKLGPTDKVSLQALMAAARMPPSTSSIPGR